MATRKAQKEASMAPVKTIGRSPAAKARQASGYGDSAAGWMSRTWQGFWATSGSSEKDIDVHTGTLRRRARSIWYRSGIARSIIQTYADWTIGSGLDLKVEGSGGRELEDAFVTWASSKYSDSREDSDFYSLMRQAYELMLLDGDCFLLLRRIGGEDGKVHLIVELIEADTCSTPDSVPQGKTIVEGVEIGRWGEATAYHFKHGAKWRRYTKTTPDGQAQVIHLRRRERLAIRGTTILAPVLEPILQIGRYMDSELQSALIESCFSVCIKSSEEDPESLVSQDPAQASNYNFSLGQGNINFLPEDSEVTTIDGHRDRNASSLETYVDVALRSQICSAVGIPYEILRTAFSSSYSASRAACVLFARRAEMQRDAFVLDLLTPVWEAWLEVRRINGEPVPEDAGKVTWTGPVPPSLDPSKTVDYLSKAVDQGFMTRSQAALELSRTDFTANASRLAEENALLAKAKALLETPASEAMDASEEEEE